MQDQHRSLHEPGRHGPLAPGLGFLHGAGAVGALIRGLGPAACPLGPPEGWPATLRAVLGTLLPARAQIVVFWGEDSVALYNDAFTATIGAKHPQALGRPARENWGEVWDTLAPMLDGVRRSGEPLEARDLRFLTDRHGFPEEAFFDASCSAVHEDGAVAGVLCIVTETTDRVLAARRVAALRASALRLTTATSPAEACAAALEALAAENPHDLPWGRILLAGAEGLAEVAAHGAAGAPEGLPGAALSEAADAAMRDATPQEVPGGLILPLSTVSGVTGVLFAGLNPHLRQAGEYRDYLSLAAGQISLAVARLRREEEDRRTNALLRDSESRFRAMADSAPVMIWMTEPDGQCSYLNQRWYDWTGQMPGAGHGYGWAEMVHPEDRAAAAEAAARSMAARQPFQLEYRLHAADGSYGWIIDAATPRLDAEGRFAGFIGAVLDIDARRRAEEARDLLSRELSHRIKNIFMVIGGLATITARGDAAAEAFSARLQSRLQALSLAHDLVRPEPRPGCAGPRPGPSVHALLRALLAPYVDPSSGRVTLEGEDSPVGGTAANALALVLHEQATNAVKHGALSSAAGRLRIATRIEEGELRLEWREMDGPPVPGLPTRQGFGTVLSARSLGGQVQGRIEHEWHPDGLVVRLAVPLPALMR